MGEVTPPPIKPGKGSRGGTVKPSATGKNTESGGSKTSDSTKKDQKSRTMGRPKTPLSKKTVSLLMEAFKDDCTVTEACILAKIGRATYYRHYDNDPTFRDKMEASQKWPIIHSKRAMMKQIKDGDGALALRHLERRQRDRYATKVEAEIPQAANWTVVVPGGTHPHVDKEEEE